MLDVMKYTAQVVSRVVASPEARNEVMGYALQEFDGEVVANFNELLTGQAVQRSLANGIQAGKFAELFRPHAKQYAFRSNEERSSSVNDLISDLELYLKENNLALYGPYLAENHSNTTKPFTVSFDPLDDTKTTNIGYIFVPKSTSGGSSANSGGIDAPMNFNDYELVEIADIDDDYAYDNPVVVIIPDGGYGGGSSPDPPRGSTPQPIPNNGIDCEDLLDNDIVRPYMDRFRLTDNLRGGFWNRNLLNMYAITKDDITFDINGDAQINTGVSKVWNQIQVSRKHARNQTWKDANQVLDSNWTLDEDNLFLAVSYKRVNVSISEISVEVKGLFTGKPEGKVGSKLKFEEKQELLFSFSHDKCATLALYKIASPAGFEDSRRVEKFGRMEYTLDVEWRRR